MGLLDEPKKLHGQHDQHRPEDDRVQLGLPGIVPDMTVGTMHRQQHERAHEARLEALRDRQALKRHRARLREQERRHLEKEARSRAYWTKVAAEMGLVNEDEE